VLGLCFCFLGSLNCCRESLIEVPEPQILPYFKPVDYVEVLTQIHEELESCHPQERSSLFCYNFKCLGALVRSNLERRHESIRSKLVKEAFLPNSAEFPQK
jgi:hypothetical protein